MTTIRLEDSWRQLLVPEFEKLYFSNLVERVREEYRMHSPIYPEGRYIFRALDLCPVDKVKVVILGQDPYHGAGQAEGLAFSVPPGVAVPPSLRNIKKEILEDLGKPSILSDGHLLPWVEQGVLLLNSTLTVRAGQAGSHQGLGWESFTDALIACLAEEKKHLVFMLWGAYARRKGAMINRAEHLVLESAHPSPLSASRFMGCRHFSQANAYLEQIGKTPIRW